MAEKRLLIKGLPPNVSENEVEKRFKPYGKVSDIKMSVRKDMDGQIMDLCAHLSITCTEKDFIRCKFVCAYFTD